MTNANENKAAELLDAATAAATTPAKKKATRKAPAKAKAPAKPKAPAKEKAPVIPPTLLEGDAKVADGADVSVIKTETDNVVSAIAAIEAKDGELLDSYLALGAFASKVSPMFASTKDYGQYLAAKVPSSQKLDASLRTHCKWLYEALNNVGTTDKDGKRTDHPDADILSVLGGINDIRNHSSQNPTTIYRHVQKAKANAAAAKAAADAGIEIGEDEDAAAVLSAREKAEEAKRIAAVIQRYAKALGDMAGKKGKSADQKATAIEGSVISVLEAAFGIEGNKSKAEENMVHDMGSALR